MCPEKYCPKTEFDKVLLADDRTVFSRGAVREAIIFARQCSSFLYILTVLEHDSAYELLGEDFVHKKEQEAMEYLESVKAEAEEEGVVGCETILCRDGDPSKFILDEAVSRNVSMIVVGRHGHSAVERVILGSVTSEVIAKAPCKVLVAAVGTRIEYKNILVATDGSEHAQAAVQEALNIAKRCGSRLLVVSVAHSKGEAAEAEKLAAEVSALAAKAGVVAEAMTPTGIASERITEIGHKQVVDLIVMGTFGKTGLRYLLMGSTTEKVIEASHCAVLVVNPPA